MGYLEATEDGIRSVEVHKHLRYYFPKCSICGDEMQCLNCLRKFRYICKRCRFIEASVDKRYKQKENEFIHSQQLTKAIKRISKQWDILKYQNAIDGIISDIRQGVNFGSTEEVMVALELKRKNINYRQDVKFGRYRADFVLDDMKVVLEVDGKRYHTPQTAPREEIRDSLIVLQLGAGWEVIRITDDCINENIARLMSGIRAVKIRRDKIRAKNNNELPAWYSRRKI